MMLACHAVRNGMDCFGDDVMDVLIGMLAWPYCKLGHGNHGLQPGVLE